MTGSRCALRRIFLSRPRPQGPALRRMSCERGGDDGLPARRRITGGKVAATAAKMRDCEVTDDRRTESRVQELVRPAHRAASEPAFLVVTLRELARPECAGDATENRARSERQPTGSDVSRQAAERTGDETAPQAGLVGIRSAPGLEPRRDLPQDVFAGRAGEAVQRDEFGGAGAHGLIESIEHRLAGTRFLDAERVGRHRPATRGSPYPRAWRPGVAPYRARDHAIAAR